MINVLFSLSLTLVPSERKEGALGALEISKRF